MDNGIKIPVGFFIYFIAKADRVGIGRFMFRDIKLTLEYKKMEKSNCKYLRILEIMWGKFKIVISFDGINLK